MFNVFSDFISHSFSILELQFLFQHSLPDLAGRLVVDVGSRLGAVLYGVKYICRQTDIRMLLWKKEEEKKKGCHCLWSAAKCGVAKSVRLYINLWLKGPFISVFQGYLYSSATQLVGVEISAEFVRLQNMAVEKYGFSDRIQVECLSHTRAIHQVFLYLFIVT